MSNMENNFSNHYMDLYKAIDHCIKEKLRIPSLILIYSAIDSISWLTCCDSNMKVGERFRKWVNNWLLKAKSLPCSAEELYASRCGILHALSPDSNKSKNKSIKQIAYAWGTGTKEDLHEAVKIINQEDLVVSIHLNDLFNAYMIGFANCIEETMKDKEAYRKFSEKVNKIYGNVDKKIIDAFLHKYGKKKL